MKLIADNFRITRPSIQAALDNKDPAPVKALAEQISARKPWAIDVNTGPLSRLPEQGMRFFIQGVESGTDLPLFIDTTHAEAMRTGLKTARNRAIINGFSLEPEKLSKILPLAKEFDTDIVGFLLYPDSRVPKDETERYSLALDLLDKAEAAGVPKEKIIIDPVVPPLVWEDGIVQARAVIKVIETLPDLLGFKIRTIAGVSNLSTNGPDRDKRNLVDAAYVSMLARAGLDFALLDIMNPDLVRAARTADILARESLFSWGLVPEIR